MKTILRNLLSVLRRFKMATLLNVLGLSVAFSAFILIMMQVDYDRNFDRGIKDVDRIFRVEVAYESGTKQAIINRPLAEAFIRSSPHILAGSLLDPWGEGAFFYTEENGVRNNFKERWMRVFPEYADIFTFDMLDGSADKLKEPNMVLLPLSLSSKLFGNQSAVGKQLHMANSKGVFTVGGVYRDFPDNSSVGNSIYYQLNPKENFQNFGNWNYMFYVRLDDPANASGLFENFKAHFDVSTLSKDFSWEGGGMSLVLNPLTEVHFDSGVTYDNAPKASKSTMLVLFAIAIVIVVIAGINFTNFSTALTPLRVRSINTQKVLGSSYRILRGSLLIEAVLISLIAWLIGLWIVWGLDRTVALPFLEADLDFSVNIPVIVVSGLIAMLTGIIAGLYPSYYVTSFPPALVLKGSFGLSPVGRKLRMVLIGFQFVVSILLIILSCFMGIQSHYIRNFSLGFDKDAIAIVELNPTLYDKHHTTYVDRLKGYPGIEDVAFSTAKVGAGDNYSYNTVTYKDQEFTYFNIRVSSNFFQVMGISVAEGREFSKADEGSENVVYIFNRAAHIGANMKEGDNFHDGRIIGFTDHVKFTSLRDGENNIAFSCMSSKKTMPVSYIRLKAGTDMFAAVDYIRETLKGLDSAYPFDVEFYDEIFDNLYHKEDALRDMITVFGLLAIILSLVGVFGLVVFDTQYRRKEIGIRKVHGATVGEILRMFNKSYVRIVIVCFVIAAPVAWLGVEKWLENFAYKTPVYGWVFLLALVVVCFITLLTVSFQCWRAANANPVDSIKTE